MSKWLDGGILLPVVTGDPALASLDRTNDSILDVSRLEHLRNTEGGVLESAVDNYIKQSPLQLESLRQGLASGDTESLFGIAHDLKSTSATIGATMLSAKCAALEEAGRSGLLEQAPDLIQSIADDLPDVISALRRALEKLSESPAADLGVRADGQHVWLVDDDDGFRETAATVLRTVGFQVTTATDGGQVLSMSMESKPDLLLLDAVMNNMDGFEACRLLHESWRDQDIPILMVTGRDDLDSVNKAFASGADDFIVKPINYPILVRRILFQLRAASNHRLLRNSNEMV